MKRKREVIRLPQLCFHGNPDTEPCAACTRDGGKAPVGTEKHGREYLVGAELIVLAPKHSQYRVKCETKGCEGKSLYLAIWYRSGKRTRLPLCELDAGAFAARAKITMPEKGA